MLEADLLSFVRSSIRSTWALELLLLLQRQPARSFSREELVRELRATPSLIATCLKQLQEAGLLACEGPDHCRFAPASPALEALCAQLDTVYRERPVTVINTIMTSPNDRLQNFADAFRFTKKDD